MVFRSKALTRPTIIDTKSALGRQAAKSDKRTGLYCVGSALVDYEVRVSDDYLKEHSIAKGRTTLVDEASFRYHFEEGLRSAAGQRAGGGSAVNSLVTYARLGGAGSLCCLVADDESGRFFTQELSDLGLVITGAEPVAASLPTGHCLVLVTPDAERTMLAYLGVNRHLAPPVAMQDALARRAFFYAEGYLVAEDAQYATLTQHLQTGRDLALGLALNLSDVTIVQLFRPRLRQCIDAGLDILFGNKEEFMEYTNQSDADKMAAALADRVATLVITDGAGGSVVYSAGQKIETRAAQVNAVDTLGAGDAYVGAFLYAVQEQGCDLRAAAALASAAAGQVVTRFGPRLTAQECAELHRASFG